MLSHILQQRCTKNLYYNGHEITGSRAHHAVNHRCVDGNSEAPSVGCGGIGDPDQASLMRVVTLTSNNRTGSHPQIRLTRGCFELWKPASVTFCIALMSYRRSTKQQHKSGASLAISPEETSLLQRY
ncbi:unnamed protein product [Dicrocoelium dendriticum]|nr:unnamed protein product [Dicrocoelium dendriticum]